MCKVLKISRSLYYYKAKRHIENSRLVNSIIHIFKINHNNYGTRKLNESSLRLALMHPVV